MQDKAKSKLINEFSSVKGKKEKAMAFAVQRALINFCDQNIEFAQAIAESDKTFGDCMSAVAKNVGESISDIEAYRRAVQFYFLGADIEYTMTINLSASVEKNERAIKISLLDLL